MAPCVAFWREKQIRIATLKIFLKRVPKDRVKEVCIDMKESLRKAAEELFPKAKIVVDPFHVVVDSNGRMDETRRIGQDVHWKKRVRIAKKIFLIGGERLNEGCNTKIKMLKRVSYGLRNVEVYWRKMLLGFVPSRSYFHTILHTPLTISLG